VASVLLGGYTLLDELVLGRSETALDGRSEDGRTELGGQTRGCAEDLSLSDHLEGVCCGTIRFGLEGRLFFVAN